MRPGQLLFWATSPLSGTRPGALGRGGSEPPICYDLTPPPSPSSLWCRLSEHQPRSPVTDPERPGQQGQKRAGRAGAGCLPGLQASHPSFSPCLSHPFPQASLPGAPLSTPVKWGGTHLCGVFSGSVHREAGTSCTLTPTDLLGLARLVPWRPLPPYGALSSGPHCACTPMPWTHRAPQSRGLLSWEARAPARSAGTR